MKRLFLLLCLGILACGGVYQDRVPAWISITPVNITTDSVAFDVVWGKVSGAQSYDFTFRSMPRIKQLEMVRVVTDTFFSVRVAKSSIPYNQIVVYATAISSSSNVRIEWIPAYDHPPPPPDSVSLDTIWVSAPIVSDVFARYSTKAQMFANTSYSRFVYPETPNGDTIGRFNKIVLDTTEKMMRYVYDPFTPVLKQDTVVFCGARGEFIGRTLNLPDTAYTNLWVEFKARFSSGFNLYDSVAYHSKPGCAWNVSSVYHLVWFRQYWGPSRIGIGLRSPIRSPNSAIYGLPTTGADSLYAYVGCNFEYQYSYAWNISQGPYRDPFGNCNMGGYVAVPFQFGDGQWHTYKIHVMTDVDTLRNNTLLKLWVDNVVVIDMGGFKTPFPGIANIGLGAGAFHIPRSNGTQYLDWKYVAAFTSDPRNIN